MTEDESSVSREECPQLGLAGTFFELKKETKEERDEEGGVNEFVTR